MSSITNERDCKIYRKYLFSNKDSEALQDIANTFGLKVVTIKKIIKKYDKYVEERDLYIEEMYKYLREHYPHTSAGSIRNSLIRHAKWSNNYIFTKETLIEEINSGKYIKGIGVKFRAIINEYMESTK